MMTPLGDGVDLLEVSCQLKFLRRRIIVECFDQLNTHTHTHTDGELFKPLSHMRHGSMKKTMTKIIQQILQSTTKLAPLVL